MEKAWSRALHPKCRGKILGVSGRLVLALLAKGRAHGWDPRVRSSSWRPSQHIFVEACLSKGKRCHRRLHLGDGNQEGQDPHSPPCSLRSWQDLQVLEARPLPACELFANLTFAVACPSASSQNAAWQTRHWIGQSSAASGQWVSCATWPPSASSQAAIRFSHLLSAHARCPWQRVQKAF